jgi:hypothetical protein
LQVSGAVVYLNGAPTPDDGCSEDACREFAGQNRPVAPTQVGGEKVVPTIWKEDAPRALPFVEEKRYAVTNRDKDDRHNCDICRRSKRLRFG